MPQPPFRHFFSCEENLLHGLDVSEIHKWVGPKKYKVGGLAAFDGAETVGVPKDPSGVYGHALCSR